MFNKLYKAQIYIIFGLSLPKVSRFPHLNGDRKRFKDKNFMTKQKMTKNSCFKKWKCSIF